MQGMQRVASFDVLRKLMMNTPGAGASLSVPHPLPTDAPFSQHAAGA